MYDLMSREGVKYIIGRVIKNAEEAMVERKQDPENAFLHGRAQAFYETLDIIKSELTVREEDLKEYGLDVQLEKLYY